MADTALLRKLDSGDISNIKSEVKAALSVPGQSEFAHRILLRLSNLCIGGAEGKPVLTDDNVALELVSLCFKTISADRRNEETIPAKSRTIIAIFNVYSRFYASKNLECAIPFFDEVYPILKKMLSSMSDSDMKYVYNFAIKTHNLILSTADKIVKEDSRALISLCDLWDRMLLIGSLLSPDKSLAHIISVLKHISSKYEKCHGLEKAEKISSFNNILLEKLVSFSVLSPKLESEEAVDKVFGMLVPILHQFLVVEIKAGLLKMESKALSLWLKLVTFFKTKHYTVECFELISRIVRLFLFQHTDSEIVINELSSICNIFEEKRNNITPAFSWVLYIGGCICLQKANVKLAIMNSFCTLSTVSALNGYSKLLSELLLSCSNGICSGADGEACTLKSDVYLAFKSRITFTSLCMDYQKEIKEEWSNLVILIKDSFKCLESMLKQAIDGNCVKRSAMEGSLCDSYCSIGGVCYSNEDWEHGRLFMLRALSIFSSVKKDISSTEQTKVDAILSRLAHCCDKQGQAKEAKAAVLFDILLHLKIGTPQHSIYSEQWSGLQNGNPNDAKTAEQFLKRHPSFLKTMFPTFTLDLKLVPDLLLWELSCYAKYKMVNTSIVLNAWHALVASKPSALHLLEGSALAGHGLFLCSDTVAWHVVISASLSSWLCEIKNLQERGIALCAMAVHYHMKFLILAQQHFDENESSVEEQTIYSRHPSTVRKPDDVIDPKDVCQIRSSFSNLTLQREQELMDLLDTAVNYWDESIKAGLSIEDYNTHTVVSLSGDYLLQGAYLYSLWGHNAGAAKTFQVCCTFAEKMHIDDLHLQALSGLMSTIEVKQECISESDKLLKRLKNHPKIHYLSLVHSTSRAFQALRTKSYLEGETMLKDIVDLKPTMSSIWCYTYTKLLQASYSLIPGTKFGSGLRPARQGLSLTVHYIQDKRLSESPLVFAALIHHALSCALWIGRYYRQHLMPREARCFLKPELMLALKLGLATRAAEFICELAFVDLVTENIDEARSKIGDLEGIIKDSQDSKTDTTGAHSDDEHNDMFTTENITVPNDTRNILGASPSLKEVFHLPTDKHNISCRCYLCKNSSVQNVLLMFGHLQAKISMLRFEVHSSMNIYSTVFKAAKKALMKLTKNAVSQGSLLQQHDVVCSEVLLQLDFVDFLVMYGKDHDAMRQNQGVLDLLKNLRTDDKQLLAYILEQKLCISRILQKKEKRATGCGDASRLNLSQTSLATSLDKTPENTRIGSPQILGGKRKPLKPVTTPNMCISPVTDQQFFTPKAPLGHKTLFKDSDDDLFKDDDDLFKDDDNLFKDTNCDDTFKIKTKTQQPSKENKSLSLKKNNLILKNKNSVDTSRSRTKKEENSVVKVSRSVRVPNDKAGSINEESESTSSSMKSISRSKIGGLSVRTKASASEESLSAKDSVKGKSAKASAIAVDSVKAGSSKASSIAVDSVKAGSSKASSIAVDSVKARSSKASSIAVDSVKARSSKASSIAVDSVKARSAKANLKTDLSTETIKSTTRITRQKRL